jgi:hypothetical protein
MYRGVEVESPFSWGLGLLLLVIHRQALALFVPGPLETTLGPFKGDIFRSRSEEAMRVSFL